MCVEVPLGGAIGRRGPIPFDEVVAAALYSPDGGFYTGEGRAGRRGDFVTSAEVGPLFGTLVGRALDDWWIEARRPDVFVVVEACAGPGTLPASTLASQPAHPHALPPRPLGT